MGIRFLLYMIAVHISLIIIKKRDSFTFGLKCFLVIGQILVCFVWTRIDFPEVFWADWSYRGSFSLLFPTCLAADIYWSSRWAAVYMDSDCPFPEDMGILFVTCTPSYLCILVSQC